MLAGMRIPRKLRASSSAVLKSLKRVRGRTMIQKVYNNMDAMLPTTRMAPRILPARIERVLLVVASFPSSILSIVVVLRSNSAISSFARCANCWGRAKSAREATRKGCSHCRHPCVALQDPWRAGLPQRRCSNLLPKHNTQSESKASAWISHSRKPSELYLPVDQRIRRASPSGSTRIGRDPGVAVPVRFIPVFCLLSRDTAPVAQNRTLPACRSLSKCLCTPSWWRPPASLAKGRIIAQSARRILGL